jgi:hypothetical protein
MNDTKGLLQRARSQFPPPEGVMESLRGRRDRKRRNQRIAAGVVGIAVFVAAVWIVTSGGSLDRSRTSVVPGGDVTGPAAETGPVEAGPTVAPDTGSNGNGYRIPPAGTAVSTPVEGELIAEAFVGFAGQIRVYADGRVISAERNGGIIVERRLSPEGIELVRQVLGERVYLDYGPGAVRLESLLGHPGSYPGDIRQSAWEDREGKPYVPARYGLCFRLVDIPLDVEAVLNQLPASAQALLRGSDPAAGNPRCLVMTPEEARSLEEILSEALSSRGDLSLAWDVGVWSLRGGDDAQFIRLRPLFPEGRWFIWVPY